MGPTLGFPHPPLLPAQPNCGAGAPEAPGCWPPIWGLPLPTWGSELGALCSLLRPPRAAASVPAFTMTSKLRGTGWSQVGRNTGSRSPGAPSCPTLHGWATGTPTLPARRTAPGPSLFCQLCGLSQAPIRVGHSGAACSRKGPYMSQLWSDYWGFAGLRAQQSCHPATARGGPSSSPTTSHSPPGPAHTSDLAAWLSPLSPEDGRACPDLALPSP